MAGEVWVERAMQVLPSGADLHGIKQLMESYVRDEARIGDIASCISEQGVSSSCSFAKAVKDAMKVQFLCGLSR